MRQKLLFIFNQVQFMNKLIDFHKISNVFLKNQSIKTHSTVAKFLHIFCIIFGQPSFLLHFC